MMVLSRSKRRKSRLKNIPKRVLGGVIIGELKSAKEAEEYANRMENCPYLLFQATDADTICLVCSVPEENQWWLKFPEENPKRAGFKKAKVYVSTTAATSRKFLSERSPKKSNSAPCGADCRTCDLRDKYKCLGCPGTLQDEEE